MNSHALCQNQECCYHRLFVPFFWIVCFYHLFVDFAIEAIECRNSPCQGRFSFSPGSTGLSLFVYELVWTFYQFFEGRPASRLLGILKGGASFPWLSSTSRGCAQSRPSGSLNSRNTALACRLRSSLGFGSSSFICVSTLVLDKTLRDNLAESGIRHKSQPSIKRNYGLFVTFAVFW